MTKVERKQIRDDILDLAEKLRNLGYDSAAINRMTSDLLDLPLLNP